MHHAPAHVERRAHDAVGPCPLEGEHDSDDVDDGIERADLMKVNLLHRHLVDSRFDFGQALEHSLRAVAAGGRERGLIDELEDRR
jgi:hypothetical protein